MPFFFVREAMCCPPRSGERDEERAGTESWGSVVTGCQTNCARSRWFALRRKWRVRRSRSSLHQLPFPCISFTHPDQAMIFVVASSSSVFTPVSALASEVSASSPPEIVSVKALSQASRVPLLLAVERCQIGECVRKCLN
ncbi:hypothetical protein MPTK1_4g14420 [Marchantia polymorpha subsp. ruderalis]